MAWYLVKRREKIYLYLYLNGVTVVVSGTSRNLILKSFRTMFAHGNIHKYIWTSPDGKIHTHIDV